jgi:hypothetical protein
MILKFVKLAFDEERVFDNIREYTLKRKQEVEYKKEAVEKLIKNKTIDMLNIAFHEDDNIPSEKMFSYSLIICKDMQGNEFSIVFNCTLYICNNQGKTIDTLYF